MKDIIDKIFDQIMDEVCDDPVRRFAELVAAAASAKEREACAKVCDEWGEAASVELAAAIRARGDRHD